MLIHAPKKEKSFDLHQMFGNWPIFCYMLVLLLHFSPTSDIKLMKYSWYPITCSFTSYKLIIMIYIVFFSSCQKIYHRDLRKLRTGIYQYFVEFFLFEFVFERLIYIIFFSIRRRTFWWWPNSAAETNKP